MSVLCKREVSAFSWEIFETFSGILRFCGGCMCNVCDVQDWVGWNEFVSDKGDLDDGSCVARGSKDSNSFNVSSSNVNPSSSPEKSTRGSDKGLDWSRDLSRWL